MMKRVVTFKNHTFLQMKICKKTTGIPRIPNSLPIKSLYEIDNNPENKNQVFGRKISMKSGPGYTADVKYYPESGYVTKEFIRYHKYSIYEREVFWLLYLNYKKYSWCPKIIYHDDRKKIIYMTYVGNRITKENTPENWCQQLTDILRDLENEELTHNDIKPEDILVLNGKLFLIDYGWMCWKNDLSCAGRFSDKQKPGESYPDNSAISRLRNYLFD